MLQLKKVIKDDIYEIINSYVTTNSIEINNYNNMVEVILKMIKEGYCFVVDRDILRDTMECLTYMYYPCDDMNKDRVIQQLCDEESDSDSESDCVEGEESDENIGNMDFLKMMQMMGAQMPPPCKEEYGLNECPSEECPSEDVN